MVDRRRLNNMAAVLPMFGAALILPPLVNVFTPNIKVFSVSLIVIYLFSVWLGLIMLTLLLSRRLRRMDTHYPDDGASEAAGTDD